MIALLALALADDVEALARADDALAGCHAVANGVVTMRWNVRRGTVVELASDGDPGLGVCVGDRIRAWRFEDDGAYTHTFVVPDRATVTVLPSGRDSSDSSDRPVAADGNLVPPQVYVQADGVVLRFVGADGVAVGAEQVTVGTYELVGVFGPGQEPVALGDVAVGYGDQIRVRCNTAVRRCRVAKR
jgi:hypothetical protein